MLTLSPAVRIYVATGATDPRRSIDGLVTLVGEHFQLDPLSGHFGEGATLDGLVAERATAETSRACTQAPR